MKKLLLLIVLIAAMFSVGAQTQVPVLIEGFDGGGLPSGWVVIDADNDAVTWAHSSAFPISYYTFPTHNGSSGSFYSASINLQNYSPLTPDNWLVSPAVSLSGSSMLTYWMRISDGYYPGDHYGVFVTTVSNPTPSDFTQLSVETMTADDEVWGMRTVNLDSYAGQTVRIAFRHFGCTDQFCLGIDDIRVGGADLPTLSLAGLSNVALNSSATFTATSDVTPLAWYVDGVQQTETGTTFTTTFTTLGNHTVKVSATNAAGTASDSIVVNVVNASVTSFPRCDTPSSTIPLNGARA